MPKNFTWTARIGGLQQDERGTGNQDDVSDGFVQATQHMEDGSSIDLEPAWVIVGSPKYAPS